MDEKKRVFAALAILSRWGASLWQNSKLFKVVVVVASVFLVAVGTFIVLNQFEKRQRRVFAATSAVQVELPEGIEKEDLPNLSSEQKEKLDRQVTDVIKARIEKEGLVEESRQVVVVVLTQNGQPILPDLNKEESQPGQPTPTLAPSSTPVPLPPCTDADGGKDYFTKGTVITSYGDKKVDFCSDPNIVGEYSCGPGAAFFFDGYICPDKCVDGACLKVTPTPMPTQVISPTEVPSPTITPTPTSVPCTDSDGGKDIYTKGVVNTWGKSYEDICYSLQSGEKAQCSDYFCRLLEYSCQPQGYQGEPFICQYGCQNGACLKEAPSPTVTPGGQRCLDTDSQDRLDVKGTIYIDGQVKASDHCQLSWWNEQRHFWDYKFIQSCPAHSNDNYYSSTSNPSGNKTDRCMISEQKCDSFDSDQYHGTVDYCSGGCDDGVCTQVIPTPTPVPTENELTFIYEGDVEQRYKSMTGKDLKDVINEIYQSMKKIFGSPFNNNTVRVRLGPDYSYSDYNISTNELTLVPQQFSDIFALLGQMFYAFYDDSIYYLPQNWHYGFFDFARTEVQIDAFVPERKSQMRPYNNSFYELTASSPAWASKDGRIDDTFDKANPSNLLAMTFYKIYLEDNQFFVKFDKELFKQTMDNTLKDKLASVAVGVKPTVEGMSFADWYASHYLLQVKPIPGKYLMPSLEVNGSEVAIIIKAIEVLNDGTKRESSDSQSSYIQIFDFNNNRRHDYEVAHYEAGGMNMGRMPTHETTPNIPADFRGTLRFDIEMIGGFAQVSFYYPYENGRPIVPGGSPVPGVFGTINRSEGYVRFKGSNLAIDSIILDGMFQSKQTFTDVRGAVELSYITPEQNVSPSQSGSNAKVITKDFGDYYTNLRMVSAASTRGGSPPTGEVACADGWQEYTDERLGLKFKIPSGWTDDSIDEQQSDTFIYRHLISTTRPEEQMDPSYKVSHFDLLASTSDFKVSSDYGYWFDNNTGNQQKSEVDFKGVSAEKYVDDTSMPCVSQAEAGVACDYHSEMYYFKKDDFYYVLSLGIYTPPELKEKNEATLKCFLENFELSGQEQAIDGMKLFTSEKLRFKIRYPAELFAHEWPSDYKPNFNGEKPDSDRNVAQFFENKDLTGEKITIRRDTNPQRKTAKDFAKAYWSAGEENLRHWQPGNIDFVVYSVSVQGSEEKEKTYFAALGDWMYVFDGSDISLQSTLEKMLPTLEFLGSGEGFSEDLIPCPEDLFSTAEQLEDQQENWWEKPDPCQSRPEQKVCGYTRSIHDNGMIQVGNSDYRNPYCYCSFFEKNGGRVYRGTEMFSLGYQEGACKRKL